MFHGQRELEAEIESASDTEPPFERMIREDQHEDNRESKESDIESEPALAMAGVTCPVSSHQVEAKEVYPVSNYIDRATDIYSDYRFHDGRKFKDTVF